MYEL